MKSAKAKQRYKPEDLQPRDLAADEAALDAWLFRNKDALNESARKALEEFKRGEHYSDEDVTAAFEAQRRRTGE